MRVPWKEFYQVCTFWICPKSKMANKGSWPLYKDYIREFENCFCSKTAGPISLKLDQNVYRLSFFQFCIFYAPQIIAKSRTEFCEIQTTSSLQVLGEMFQNVACMFLGWSSTSCSFFRICLKSKMSSMRLRPLYRDYIRKCKTCFFFKIAGLTLLKLGQSIYLANSFQLCFLYASCWCQMSVSYKMDIY